MVFKEEVLSTVIKGMLQSIVSDCAMSGKDPANHWWPQCSCFTDVYNKYPEGLSDLHTVPQLARGKARL